MADGVVGGSSCSLGLPTTSGSSGIVTNPEKLSAMVESFMGVLVADPVPEALVPGEATEKGGPSDYPLLVANNETNGVLVADPVPEVPEAPVSGKATEEGGPSNHPLAVANNKTKLLQIWGDRLSAMARASPHSGKDEFSFRKCETDDEVRGIFDGDDRPLTITLPALLYGGWRVPMSDLMARLCEFYQLLPCQLPPNTHRIVHSMEHLSDLLLDLGKIKNGYGLKELLACYEMIQSSSTSKAASKGPGLRQTQNNQMIFGVTYSNKGVHKGNVVMLGSWGPRDSSISLPKVPGKLIKDGERIRELGVPNTDDITVGLNWWGEEGSDPEAREARVLLDNKFPLPGTEIVKIWPYRYFKFRNEDERIWAISQGWVDPDPPKSLSGKKRKRPAKVVASQSAVRVRRPGTRSSVKVPLSEFPASCVSGATMPLIPGGESREDPIIVEKEMRSRVEASSPKSPIGFIGGATISPVIGEKSENNLFVGKKGDALFGNSGALGDSVSEGDGVGSGGPHGDANKVIGVSDDGDGGFPGNDFMSDEVGSALGPADGVVVALGASQELGDSEAPRNREVTLDLGVKECLAVLPGCLMEVKRDCGEAMANPKRSLEKDIGVMVDLTLDGVGTPRGLPVLGVGGGASLVGVEDALSSMSELRVEVFTESQRRHGEELFRMSSKRLRLEEGSSPVTSASFVDTAKMLALLEEKRRYIRGEGPRLLSIVSDFTEVSAECIAALVAENDRLRKERLEVDSENVRLKNERLGVDAEVAGLRRERLERESRVVDVKSLEERVFLLEREKLGVGPRVKVLEEEVERYRGLYGATEKELSDAKVEVGRLSSVNGQLMLDKEHVQDTHRRAMNTAYQAGWSNGMSYARVPKDSLAWRSRRFRRTLPYPDAPVDPLVPLSPRRERDNEQADELELAPGPAT